MYVTRRLLAALALALVAIESALGAPQFCSGFNVQKDVSAPVVLFVNGIRNEDAKAACSSEDLNALLKAKKLSVGPTNYTYFWNSTEGFLDDNNEMVFQTAISNLYLGQHSGGSEEYYIALGRYYEYWSKNQQDLTDKVRLRVIRTTTLLRDRIISLLSTYPSVVVVPHSQGTFYVEAAYGMMMASGLQQAASRLRVVGVASVAATSPTPGRYVTQDLDRAIMAQAAKHVGNPNYLPLASNLFACNVDDPCSHPADVYSIDWTGHGFSEIYLSTVIYNKKTDVTFANTLVSLIDISLTELKGMNLFDDFTSAALNSNYWSREGAGEVTVIGGVMTTSCRAYITTRNKVLIGGKRIVVEGGFYGPGALRDTAILLSDVNSPNDYIQAGDTNYHSNGLYIYGAGAFGVAQLGSGASTMEYKEYRLTIDGKSVTLERGSTLANITETVTRTLAVSIEGRAFILNIGSGGVDYCPAKYDWIRVIAEPVFSDSFDRATSSIIGNGWTEESYSQSGTNAVDAVSIEGNRLRVAHNFSGANIDAGVYRPLSQSCGIKVSGSVEWVTNFAGGASIVLNGLQQANQRGLQVQFSPALNYPHVIYLVHENESLTPDPVPFTFTVGVVYQYEWKISASCSSELRVWRSDQLKPATATATTPPVTLVSRPNPKFALISAGGSGCCSYPGYDVRFDDLEIVALN